jgi:hypothetical protein
MMREHDEYQREHERQQAQALACRPAPIPVYLGGASREAGRVRRWAAGLESTGLVQVIDRWFDGAEQWAGRDGDHAEASQRAITREHFDNIRRARIFWLLYPNERSAGSLVELGYALAHRAHEEPGWLRVVATGFDVLGTVFTANADFRHASDAQGLRDVLQRAQALIATSAVHASLRDDPRAWVT